MQLFRDISEGERQLAIQRITALWALNECGLGGILHALQSPFTGIIVGSIAMLCVALLCAFSNSSWSSVMSSLLVVLIIKAIVSPHSSPTAYFAVSFQAVTGVLLYRFIPGLFLASLIFSVTGLVESGIQRILTLTILYGNPLWDAVDTWGQWVAERWNVVLPFSSSTMVITAYLMVHVLAGGVVGFLICKTLRSVSAGWNDPRFVLEMSSEHRSNRIQQSTKKKGWKKYLTMVLLLIMITGAFLIDADEGIAGAMVTILRVVLILSVWFLFAGPLLKRWIQRFLLKKKQGLSARVEETMDVLPHIVWIVEKAWKESAHQGWWKRWKTFLFLSVMYVLQFKRV